MVKIKLLVNNEIVDRNRSKRLHLQGLEKLRVVVAINQMFGKSLLMFQKFEASATIFP